MKKAEQTKMEANINNNYKIIRDFLILNGEGYECESKDSVVLFRTRSLDIEDFATINVNGEELSLSYPLLEYSFTMDGSRESELTFCTDNKTYGTKYIKVDDHYAEIFAKAIKNGDIMPMPFKKLEKQDAEMKKCVNECTKVGDVCMINRIKATMVDVERKIFVTTGWTFDGCFGPHESKEEALRFAERMNVNISKHIPNMIKAHFAICYTVYNNCWDRPSYANLYEITREDPTIEELAAEAKRVDIYDDDGELYPSFDRIPERYRKLRVGVNEKFYKLVCGTDDRYSDDFHLFSQKVCHERPEDYKEWGVDVSKSHFRNICADPADEDAFAELWECVVVMNEGGGLRVEETPIERCRIKHNCVTKTYKSVNGFWEECIEKQ